MDRRAFTAVELLAAISILALLAALLVPIVRKSMTTARTASCQANLRQIGVAFQLYRGENNGAFPPSATDTGAYFTWYQRLLGQSPAATYDPQTRTFVDGTGGTNYLGDRRVLKCPSGSYGAMGISPGWPLGYGMTSLTLWNPPPSHRTDSVSATFFTRQLRTPSQWPLIMCADYQRIWNLDQTQATSSPSERFAARHAGVANVLMVDGHMEQARYGDERWSQRNLNTSDLY